MKNVIDFLQGTMNQDADDRLIPKGQYRMLLNGRVVDSDGSHSGVVESLSGTKLLYDEPLSFCGFKVIGMYGKDDKIYYFMNRTDRGTVIIEFDTISGKQHMLLQDIEGRQQSRDDGYLNTLCHLKGK